MQCGGMWGWNMGLEAGQEILEKVIGDLNNTHH